MTPKQRLETEAAQLRGKLRGLTQAGITGDLSDEQRAELKTLTERAEAVDLELRAATFADEPERTEKRSGDGESAEWAKLVGAASFADVLGSVGSGRALPESDPVSEMRQELDLADNAIPWELLAPVETRADTVTAPAATASGDVQQPLLARVFAQSDLARLGVNPVQAGVGDHVFPRITAGVSAAPAAADAGVDAQAATIDGVTASNRRAVARYLFRVEDAARIRGLEEALRADARSALSEALDGQVLAGGGTAPAVRGLFNGDGGSGASDISVAADPSMATTFANVVASWAALVDGRYASQLSQLRTLLNSTAFAHLAGAFRSDESDVTALDWLRERTGGASVSVHAPAAASDISTVLIHKAGTPGRNAVLALWGAPVAIRDPYSDSATGRVSLTLTQLFDFQVIRGDAWYLGKVHSG